MDWIQLDKDRVQSSSGFCLHCNETSVSTKGGRFLEELTDHQFRKKNCSI